jgi:hypothetical protein
MFPSWNSSYRVQYRLMPRWKMFFKSEQLVGNWTMETVYIETSVVSYLVARPPANTLAHQWHVWTKDWWRLRRPGFECVISAEVSREAAAGDPHTSCGQTNGGVFVSRSFAGTGQGGCSAFGRGHNLAGGLSSNVEFETSGQCGDIIEVATGGRAART